MMEDAVYRNSRRGNWSENQDENNRQVTAPLPVPRRALLLLGCSGHNTKEPTGYMQ